MVDFRTPDRIYGASLPENVAAVAREDIAARHRFINGAFIHQWKVSKHDPARLKEGHHVFTRTASALWKEYARLAAEWGPGPWEPTQRIIIDCRNFALLDASLLRACGVPARIRNGFAEYIADGSYLQDHWVCERWDGERWIADDPDIQKQNVKETEFVRSIQAWTLARRDPSFAARCGYGPDAKDRGLWAVLLGAVRDLAALDGSVCVSGDGWGLGLKKVEELTPEDFALLDDLCTRALAGESPDLPAGVAMPDRIGQFNYIDGQWREFNWTDQL